MPRKVPAGFGGRLRGKGPNPRKADTGPRRAAHPVHTLATLARWCRIRSYLDTAAAHGITALDAIRDALAGKPWLPPLPAAA